MDKTDILKVYDSPQTIFTPKDIALLINASTEESLRQKIKYFLKTNKLIKIRRGFYAKNENYDVYELAGRIYTPSYVSFETVLASEGIIFQYVRGITLASYLSREIKVSNNIIHYRRLKEEILTSRKGLVLKDGYYVASKERAYMDMVYMNPTYHFDNLRSIDWDKCEALLPIYNNKALERIIRADRKEYENA